MRALMIAAAVGAAAVLGGLVWTARRISAASARPGLFLEVER